MAPRLVSGASPLASGSSQSPYVVITEIMGDPSKTADASGEYFKLYNPGPVDVDLQGYRLVSASGTNVYTGGTNAEFHTIASSVVLPVGSCVVLGNNISSATNGGVTEAYSYGTSITLGNNSTDWIEIKTGAGVLLDSVAYSTSTVSGTTRTIVAPSMSVPTGASRVLTDPSQDNTVMAGSNWSTASTVFGAGDKGAPNSCPYTWRYDGGTIVIGPLDHVALTGATTVAAGATTQLTAVPQDANNATVTTAAVLWTTSDASIATVDNTGKVTGIAESATPVTITATATDNGITTSASQTMTVTQPEIHWIDVSSSSSSFPPGFQTQLFATARTASGGSVVPATFTFEALDPGVATITTVSNTGIIAGVSASTTKPRFRITATPTAGGNPYSFTASPVTIETPTPAAAGIYGVNDAFGDPTPASTSNADDFLITRPQYTLSYNMSRGTPNWVSYELDARQMAAGQDRCNCFTADPLLPADKQIFTSDYTSGGYDRGHMARSADRTAGNTDNAATFYLTNIVPQMADLNQGVWAQFENALADSAQHGRAVYIITGPLYTRGKPLMFLKNEGKVAVPDSTWKVAFIGPMGTAPFAGADVQSWDALAGTTVLAVNMPNVSGVRNDPWSKYLTTVDRIEASTGYDFLSLLPVAFQHAVEAGDHAPSASMSWSGSLFEGSNLTFDGSSSTDPDLARSDFSDALAYSWSFSDGTSATGAGPTRSFANDGTYSATLVVTDAYGWQSTASQSLVVANVAPQISTIAGATILRGETYTASGGFTDPGQDTWTATVDYGDGGGIASLALDEKSFQLGHTYVAAGTFTVDVAVNDGEATGGGSAVVVVKSALDGIADLASSISALAKRTGAAAGEANSLQAKLNAAAAQLRRGNTIPAANELEAFVNELEALVRSGNVDDGTAASILDYARRVIGSVGA